MQRRRFLTIMMLTAILAVGGAASADDGEINNKSMSRTINLPIDVPDLGAPEAEHAFTGMMKFYVPAQKADGTVLTDSDGTGGVEYDNIDGELVETLPVTKPLVNVFIYGPALHVDGTAFSHSWFDTYAPVSLDDGVTFKETNLS